MMYGPLTLPSGIEGETTEEWARRLWFAAYHEIYRRERELYPEHIDIGGE